MRGTPQQIIDKYQSLARDKATSGDRVMSEAFLQHAEHYMRILTASQPTRSEDRASEDRGGDDRAQDERAHEDDRGGEARASGERNAAEAGAEGMAVIGEDDHSGSDIVETPENASNGRRRGRRPARRSSRGDDEGRAPRASEPAEAATAAAEPGLPLEQPREVAEVSPDSAVRAAE